MRILPDKRSTSSARVGTPKASNSDDRWFKHSTPRSRKMGGMTTEKIATDKSGFND